MAVGMRDAHPCHGHVAGRMNRAGHAVPEGDAGLAGTRPDGDQTVSRCIGSEVGANIPPCIRRYMDTEQGARIQTPGLGDVGQVAGVGQALPAGNVCQCNVRDPSGIPRGVDRNPARRAVEWYGLASLAVRQNLHGYHDDGRSCDEADSARRHRDSVADSSFFCTGHSRESG
jgi:hypothetical protein